MKHDGMSQYVVIMDDHHSAASECAVILACNAPDARLAAVRMSSLLFPIVMLCDRIPTMEECLW